MTFSVPNRGASQPVLPPSARLERTKLEASFADFTRAAWRQAGEPVSFEDNWHIDMMADYWMAVARREIKGPGPLVVSMPPRHMKSRGLNVFLPAWVWAQNPDPNNEGHGLNVQPGTFLGPGTKFAFIGYKQALSNEHSDACRLLIKSDWYRARWGSRVKLSRDATEHFSNNAGGERRSMTFSGVTGFGADILVVDDAHDMESAESAVVRDHVLFVWDHVLQTRLNDPRTGIYIVMMQRSHERDLIGHIMAKEFNGFHICLPAEYEAQHPYVFLSAPPQWQVKRQTDSSNGTDGGPKIGEPWYDFRKEGDVLWKGRFSKETIAHQRSQMTDHAAAGQFQQRPSAREGGLFKRDWFLTVNTAPQGIQLVRSWDLASTADPKSDPDYSVGVLMGYDIRAMTFYIIDVIRGRWIPSEVENRIRSTARFDGTACRIRIPQDPGQAGKFQANYLVSQLHGYSVVTEREEGDKVFRADPLAAQCGHGFVRLVEGAWNQNFVDELCSFPNAAHDDQVDAASGAFRALVKRVSWAAA